MTAINTQVAFTHKTGMGRHCRSVLKALFEIERDKHITLFYPREYDWPPSSDLGELPANMTPIKIALTKKVMTAGALIGMGSGALARRIGRPSIYHDLSSIRLPLAANRTILSLHDAAVATSPASYTLVSRALFWRSLGWIRAADAIVTVSDYSRKVLSDVLNISISRIHVIGNGVDETFTRIRDQSAVRDGLKLLGVNQPYILYYGLITERKNVSALIRAYGILRKRLGSSNIALVIAGLPGIGSDRVFRLIRQHRLESCITYCRYPSDAQLALLLSGAEVFVFPSLDEGFGLPVLEAMACGTPVVCSNIAPLLEVGQNTIFPVGVKDDEELANGIERVLSDSELRSYLRSAGPVRARDFRWPEVARRLKRLYDDLA